MMEIPYVGFAVIEEDFNSITITVPAKKNVAIVLFLGFWLCGWAVGETSAITGVTGISHHAGPDLFLLV